PGDADDLLRVPAVDPAVRLHVSVCRHAEAGAMARRGAAADPFPAADPRRDAARRGAVGNVGRRAGAGGLHPGDDGGGNPAVPQAARLIQAPKYPPGVIPAPAHCCPERFWKRIHHLTPASFPGKRTAVRNVFGNPRAKTAPRPLLSSAEPPLSVIPATPHSASFPRKRESRAFR